MKKEEIAKGFITFLGSGSDLPAMPFRAEEDYYTATENIVKQLSDTEKGKKKFCRPCEWFWMAQIPQTDTL